MPRYCVFITETTTKYRTEYITAKNEEDAWQKAEEQFAFDASGRSDEDDVVEVTDIELED